MPLCNMYMSPQGLNIFDQMLRCILSDFSVWFGLAGSTLIEKNHAVYGRIEKGSVFFGGFSSGASVEENDWSSFSDWTFGW